MDVSWVGVKLIQRDNLWFPRLTVQQYDSEVPNLIAKLHGSSFRLASQLGTNIFNKSAFASIARTGYVTTNAL